MTKRDRVRVVNQKGQVTIPVQLRRKLDIGPGDQVTFVVEEGKLTLRPARESLRSAYGAVEPLHRPEDFGALRDRAIEEHARHTVEEMRKDDAVS